MKIKELLVGILLGDAHINRSKGGSYVTVEQSIKHKTYVAHLYDELKSADIALHEIKYYSRFDERYNNINESIYFKSHSIHLLNKLADVFISDNGTKIVPLNIKELLTPVALAYWICDDGQLVKNGGITLCTDNYIIDEIHLLIDALSENFNAKCSIHNKKGKSGKIYYRIYINKQSFKLIKPLIMDFVHKSFMYKLHK